MDIPVKLNLLDFWLIAFNLWIYFCLMAVKPRTESQSYLPNKFLSYPDVIRTSASVVPIFALIHGYDINKSLFTTSLALTTLISPLQILTVEPQLTKNATFSEYLRFSLNWILSEFDKYLKTAFVGIICYIIALLPFLAFINNGSLLTKYFSIIPRAKSSLELPLWFYLICLTVLLIKHFMLFGLDKNPRFTAYLGLLSGSIALLYFYNLTGLVSLTSDNWEAPVNGFLAGIGLKFFISMMWARLDAMHND